jgi:hypothetical protein
MVDRDVIDTRARSFFRRSGRLGNGARVADIPVNRLDDLLAFVRVIRARLSA